MTPNTFEHVTRSIITRPPAARPTTPPVRPAAPPTGPDRFHHIDALRGLLMALGVVCHAAMIYMVDTAWLVNDSRQSGVFDVVYDVLHAFRMPAFFMISGLLTERMLRKGVGRFVRDRFVRLGVPLVTAAVVLNLAQTLIVYGPELGMAGAWAEYVGGRWVGHLWFIVYLLAYGCAAAGLWAVPRGRLTSRLPTLAGAVVWLMPALSGGLRWAGETYLSESAVTYGMLDVRDLIRYAPFFAFGLAYRPGTDPAALRRMAVWSLPLLAFSVVNPLARVDGMTLYADAGVAWAGSVLCLFVGMKLLARPSAVVRRLADASYTVYLVHHIAVVSLGLALLSVPAPAGVKFVVVVTGATAGAMAFHERVVARSRWLKFLVNGSAKPTPAVRSVEPPTGVVIEARVPAESRPARFPGILAGQGG